MKNKKILKNKKLLKNNFKKKLMVFSLIEILNYKLKVNQM